MSGKDIIMIRQKELRRLHVIHRVLDGEITQVKASEMLSLSERQIRRIVKRIGQEGDIGIAHKSRGKESSRKLPEKLTERVVYLYQQKYQGFGPTLFSEKLAELEDIHISDETARKWLIEAGLWEVNRRQRTHRQWRQRKEHYGEMVQMDGSHHDWFEGRGPECVLMAYIDDATNRVYCRFYEYEGTIPAMDSFKRYIKKYGIPMSIYFDKHTTYKSTAEPTIEEEINGEEPLSEFGRALEELGVQRIYAHSPQAKGRIERLFKTLQDRLIKEMRLKGIKSVEEANKFLKTYLPKYNKKFSLKAHRSEDLHMPVPEGIDLDAILCIKTGRTVRNDNTISYQKELYQIEEVMAGKIVTVTERIDGTMRMLYQGRNLKFRQINVRPERPQKQKVKIKRRTAYIPPADHPWRKFKIGRNASKNITEVAA
ncbi:MAG: ISNCY family transposase [Nitrospirae bacterium]|nr:ISNCY family transposase [Nitrospirota bacterium]